MNVPIFYFLFCSKATREGKRARKWQRVSGTHERLAESQCHAGDGGGIGEGGGVGGWAQPELSLPLLRGYTPSPEISRH